MSSLLSITNHNDLYSSIVQENNSYEFLSRSISFMRDIDAILTESTSHLYGSLLESQSKEEENKSFASFFKNYAECIDKICMKAVEFKDELSINIETFRDANSELIDHTTIPDSCSVEYTGKVYKNLLKKDIISIDPYKAFKKEFAFIGKMMQDLSPVASDQQKTEIIATICNNLSKEINDGWLDKCIAKITGDDVTRDTYTKKIYKMFVEESNSNIEIDAATVEQCRLALSNYSSYIFSLTKQVEEMCDGLDRISDELKAMFFRNQDHKMIIKTDVEGVADKTYKLSDYSFNQFNIFLATKASQITELCNIYMTAFSIKADCIMGYMKQCKEIIELAMKPSSCSSAEEDDEVDLDAAENDIQDIQSGEDSDEGDPDTSDDYSEDDEDKEVVQEEEPTDDIETECYLFEAELYNAFRSYDRTTIAESIMQSINEDSMPKIEPAQSSSVKDHDTTEKKGLWGKLKILIDKVNELINKYVKNIDQLINSIGKLTGADEAIIKKTPIPPDTRIQRVNIAPLFNIKPVAFIYNEAEAEKLKDKKKYLQEKYSNLIKFPDDEKERENTSITDGILNAIMDKEESAYVEKDKADGITYINTASEVIHNAVNGIKKNIENAKNWLEQEQKRQPKQPPQTNNDNSNDKDKDSDGNKSEFDKKSEAVMAYAEANQSLCAAIMTVHTKVFKKHKAFMQAFKNAK